MLYLYYLMTRHLWTFISILGFATEFLCEVCWRKCNIVEHYLLFSHIHNCVKLLILWNACTGRLKGGQTLWLDWLHVIVRKPHGVLLMISITGITGLDSGICTPPTCSWNIYRKQNCNLCVITDYVLSHWFWITSSHLLFLLATGKILSVRLISTL